MPKGYKTAKTIEKEAARAALRQIVLENMHDMVDAQVKHAKGISFLVVRAKKGGKFERVDETQLRTPEFMNSDDQLFEIWQKEPSVQAFTDLMNRAIDRPAEQKFEVDLNLKGDLLGRLIAGRKRVAEGKG